MHFIIILPHPSLSFSHLSTVRLFNQGLDLIEVSDDGCGIPVESRPLLATPHATSKLQRFEDLYSAEHATLGFRGEALFALSTLCPELLVLTRTEDEPLAQKLVYNGQGILMPQFTEFAPRKRGTTVAAVRLFEALPVRRIDLQRRLPAQKARLLRLLQHYAVMCVGVELHYRIYDTRKREITLLHTPPRTKSLKDTIAAVLGTNVYQQLQDVKLDLSEWVQQALTETTFQSKNGIDEDNRNSKSNSDNDRNQSESAKSTPVARIEGYLSNPNHAALKKTPSSAKPEQYFGINGRPVDLPGVVRLVNDLWRTHCHGSSNTGGTPATPYIVWQLTLPNAVYDINVAPDKRQVQFVNEAALMACLRTQLEAILVSKTAEQSFVRADALDVTNTETKATSRLDSQDEASLSAEKPATNDGDGDGDDDDDDLVVPPPTGRFNRRYAFSHDVSSVRLQNDFDDKRKRRQSFFGFDRILPDDDDGNDDGEEEEKEEDAISETETPQRDTQSGGNVHFDHVETSQPPTKHPNLETPPKESLVVEQASASTEPATETHALTAGSEPVLHVTPSPNAWTKNDQTSPSKNAGTISASTTTAAEQRMWQRVKERFNATGHSHGPSDSKDEDGSPESDAGEQRRQFLDQFQARQKTQPLNSQLEDFGFRVERRPTQAKKVSQDTFAPQRSIPGTRTTPLGSGVASQESHAETRWDGFESTQAVNEAALAERLRMRDRKRKLTEQRQNTNDHDQIVSLRKGDFADLEIIGQFNMGFIIARTAENHLYILDQHACDEKYNFEKLCRETIIHEQRLIAPMPLDLSPTEEACILEHQDIFEQNGFRFRYDAARPPRHRFALIGLPHSGASDGRKAVQFGKDDVSALCSILSGDVEHESMVGAGTGADGSGMYGNNAVRRYAGRIGDSADRIIGRLPKAVAMFASRACRTSIMIGKALSKQEMDQVVKKLEKVEQPWNCPHGRPTMQHLGDLTSVIVEDEGKAAGALGNATVTLLSQSQEDTD